MSSTTNFEHSQKVISQYSSLLARESLSTLYLKISQNLGLAKVSLAKVSPISTLT